MIIDPIEYHINQTYQLFDPDLSFMKARLYLNVSIAGVVQLAYVRLDVLYYFVTVQVWHIPQRIDSNQDTASLSVEKLPEVPLT